MYSADIIMPAMERLDEKCLHKVSFLTSQNAFLRLYIVWNHSNKHWKHSKSVGSKKVESTGNTEMRLETKKRSFETFI